MRQLLAILDFGSLSLCPYPPIVCGACPYWEEADLHGESDWGICEKKEYPNHLTSRYDICSADGFY